MYFLELKIPPLVIMFVNAVIMWGTTKYIFDVKVVISKPISIFFLISGLIISIWAVLNFKRKNTTVDPMNIEKGSELVVSGVFKYTRNPMYLSFYLWLISLACFLNSIIAILLSFLFIIYINHFQIKPEEKFLQSRYGDSYSEYQKTVRRWI